MTWITCASRILLHASICDSPLCSLTHWIVCCSCQGEPPTFNFLLALASSSFSFLLDPAPGTCKSLRHVNSDTWTQARRLHRDQTHTLGSTSLFHLALGACTRLRKNTPTRIQANKLRKIITPEFRLENGWERRCTLAELTCSSWPCKQTPCISNAASCPFEADFSWDLPAQTASNDQGMHLAIFVTSWTTQTFTMLLFLICLISGVCMNRTMFIASAMPILHGDVCLKMPLILQARGPKCKDMCDVGWACICSCLKEVFINTKLWLLCLMSGCCRYNEHKWLLQWLSWTTTIFAWSCLWSYHLGILQAGGPKCKDMCEVGWACIYSCLKAMLINTKLWLLCLMSGCCRYNEHKWLLQWLSWTTTIFAWSCLWLLHPGILQAGGPKCKDMCEVKVGHASTPA